MTLQALCNELELPREVTNLVLSFPPLAGERSILEMLCDPARFAEGYGKLREAADDPHGLRMLAVFLRAAFRTREQYREAGIEEKIFLDTMKCFPRFIGEYRESYGEYGFDRGFWAGRQLSLLLFRLGELEFEKAERDGEPALAVHIPPPCPNFCPRAPESCNFRSCSRSSPSMGTRRITGSGCSKIGTFRPNGSPRIPPFRGR